MRRIVRSLARVIKKSRFLASRSLPPSLSLYFSSAIAVDRSAVVRMHRDRFPSLRRAYARSTFVGTSSRHAAPRRAEPSRTEPSRGERVVIGDFPAMERERATRGTNRGSPRGIPRKTRSHQDSRMLALCCTDLTYWPLQLPCTINRDPARGTLEKKERKKERKKGKKGREEIHGRRSEEAGEGGGGREEREMWLVTLLHAGLILPSRSFSFSHRELFSWLVSLFLSL